MVCSSKSLQVASKIRPNLQNMLQLSLFILGESMNGLDVLLHFIDNFHRSPIVLLELGVDRGSEIVLFEFLDLLSLDLKKKILEFTIRFKNYKFN